ncbi:M20/M25/M40 family metallo-hydrolase [Lysobacter sp. F60174L2]|uniref:M20/M25/M40 family metallo-hydrolase n=1 Tax=Lysobacter sp. F60174L2 TaxID=3459295 RepID=UPI00403DAEEB
MKLRCLTMLIAGALYCGAVSAQASPPHSHAANELASMQLESDPFAPVYIVTADKTFKGIASFARNGAARRDSIGNTLVVSEIKAHQLSQVNDYIHQREHRCGGYFAFRTRAEADAFVRSDRSADAVRSSLLADYSIDNQATVDPWLASVSESNLYDTIDHLSSYRNRYYSSSYGKASAEWIRDTWQGLAAGRNDVDVELSGCSSCSTQPSVILTVQGAELPDEVLVLGAHLDSINVNGGGSSNQVAPGADDDASGIATLTEVIRIALANGWQPRRTVKFMGYAAEEVGLRGSNAIAQSFANDGVNVVGVMQLDMTNYKSGAVDDMQLVTDYSSTALKAFLVDLFDEYLAPLGLTRGTYTCGYGCSDHASWTNAGFPAAMMFEAGDPGGYNPNIHTSYDTLQSMGESAQNSVKFAKLGLAFLGELAKTAGDTEPPENQAPTAGFSSSVNGLAVSFTDGSSDSDGNIASRSWDFGDGDSSTQTNPNHTYAADGTYDVTLTVTDNDGATDSETKSVTVAVGGGGGDGELENGVPKTGISGASKSNQYFTLVVPAGTTSLKFVTSGGNGDADLYVKFGSQPSTTSFDCKSETPTTNETCTINNVQAGTYHVLVHAWSAISGVSLTGSFNDDAPDPQDDYDYVYPQGRGSYVPGQTVVLATDGELYRCRPAPFGNWCNSTAAHFQPGVGQFSNMAWTKL